MIDTQKHIDRLKEMVKKSHNVDLSDERARKVVEALVYLANRLIDQEEEKRRYKLETTL